MDWEGPRMAWDGDEQTTIPGRQPVISPMLE